MGITSGKHIFRPQETLDHPYDITLVAKDGNEFKANRQVLSEASPLFEKLLNTDTRESKEGTVRLEMLTEAGLVDILEFIYTGRVRTIDGDNARDLITVADFLLLPRLKSLAERALAQKLDTVNCISTFYFAERYRCEDLVSDAKTCILGNFSSVGNAEEFRNLSSEEVQDWISRDDINVSAEEDVFKIILTWIDHNKSERMKYFAELFCQVRLVYVLRDSLSNNVATNDLVNDNESCLELLKDVINLIGSNNSKNMFVQPPRKSLETPTIVVYVQGHQGRCYDPRTDSWYKLDFYHPTSLCYQIVSCHSQLYFIYDITNPIACYDSFFDAYEANIFPRERNRAFEQIFVDNNNEDAIYALESDTRSYCPRCDSLQNTTPCGKHLSYITKYTPESKLWKDILSFDLGLRDVICIVAKDNLIYFIGGVNRGTKKDLTDVDRYDLSSSRPRVARRRAFGMAAQMKILITGGLPPGLGLASPISKWPMTAFTSCEVLDERTGDREWHAF